MRFYCSIFVKVTIIIMLLITDYYMRHFYVIKLQNWLSRNIFGGNKLIHIRNNASVF